MLAALALLEAYLRYHACGALLASAERLDVAALPPELRRVTMGKAHHLLTRLAAEHDTPWSRAWREPRFPREFLALPAQAPSVGAKAGDAAVLSALDLTEIAVSVRNKVAHGALSQEIAGPLAVSLLETFVRLASAIGAAYRLVTAADDDLTTTLEAPGGETIRRAAAPLLAFEKGHHYLLDSIERASFEYLSYEVDGADEHDPTAMISRPRPTAAGTGA